MSDGLDYFYLPDDASTLPDAYDEVWEAGNLMRQISELRAELAQVKAQLATLTTAELADAWPSLADMPDGEDVFLDTLGPPTGQDQS